MRENAVYDSQRVGRLVENAEWGARIGWFFKLTRTIIIEDVLMKYICLGYYDEGKWGSMPDTERNAFMDDCFAYDDVLRKNGHFLGGEALEGQRSAVTLRSINGMVSVTDGPFAETKEQLGGILILEARDLNHAIQLMSKHPGVHGGPFEIRPAADMSAILTESEKRRTVNS